MEYLEFDLEIGTINGLDYPVHVHSPAGEADGVMRFPYNPAQMDLHLKDLSTALLQSAGITRQATPAQQQAVQQMGKELFNALFIGDVLSLYHESRRIADEQEKGLRMRLRIQPPELVELPWEYLYDPRYREYLSLTASTSLIHYLPVPRAVRPQQVQLPLRVLGMLCSPAGQLLPDVSQEKQRMEVALAGLKKKGLVELNWLTGQTWRDLQDAMARGPWHVFHFIGHGGFDPEHGEGGEGYLSLTGEDGQPYPLYASELARLLTRHQGPRVVVLNACGGAQAGWGNIFSSTAVVLVQHGILSAIAMPFPISDHAVAELARDFYSMLTEGLLPVDQALTEARRMLSLAFPNSVEWGTPVLFMRSPDGVLFQIARAGETPSTPGQPVTSTPIINNTTINTGGGAYIGGNVDMDSGSFIGRDQSTQAEAKSGTPAPEEVPPTSPYPKVTSSEAPVSGRKKQTTATLLQKKNIPLLAAVVTGIFAIIVALIYGTFNVILPRILDPRATQQAMVQQTAVAGTAIFLATSTSSSTPTITQPPTITPTPESTPTTEPTATPTITLTLEPTATPPPPQVHLQKLIEDESRAVLSKDLNLIKNIFLPNAVRMDGTNGTKVNAIQWYQENFDPNNPQREEYIKAIHEHYHFVVQASTATAANDSCGTIISNGKRTDYASYQTDHWTFEQDAQGRWWVKEFAYNTPLPGSEITYAFETEQGQCPPPWEVRYYEGVAQGQQPTIIQGQGLKSEGALQFSFDTALNGDHRGQVVAYGVPFTGTASAYIYLPDSAPSTLEAGFFAQESEVAPWNYHKVTKYTPLIPGQWTQITWQVSTSGWHTTPLHLIGIEIHAKKEAYKGHVLIDDITVKIR